MKDLSIIIISFNTERITKKCIETVLRSLGSDEKIKAEIIVVDNASTDGSAEMIKAQSSKLKAQNHNIKLKTIFSKENIGFAKGNNLASKKAEGKQLLLLNSDIEVLDDAIPKLYHYFTSDDNHFDFVGGKLFERDGQTPQPSCGPFYSLPVVFAALFLRGDYWGLTRYSPDVIRDVDWVSGACIMCKTADFEKVGGFDEDIFMYMDEIDFLYRAKKKDFNVGFYPGASFVHLGSASSAGRKQPILQVYKGFLYFYKKHHTPLQRTILKGILQVKAAISWLSGKILRNSYLTETYGEAFKIVKNDR